MPGDAPQSRQPSWKSAGNPKADRAAAAQPQWKKAGPAPGATPTRLSKKSKFAIALLALGLIAGSLVWAAIKINPPKPACLVLLGAGYERNLAIPHNVYGWETVNRLAELTGGGKSGFLWWGSKNLKLQQPSPKRLEAADGWDEALKDPKEKTVVVYLAFHGGADSDGPYFLLDDPKGQARLRVKDVLKRLGELPEKKNKVLILDATQVTANWPQGMMANDFARQLEELDAAIQAVPNLVVLSASGPGQRSWVSEEWRQTIFGHYVLEGLRGAADSNHDRVITAGKLADYVRRQTTVWARNNRDALQVPVLLPKGDEGKNRAQGINLLVVDRTDYQEPALQDAPGADFKVPPDLAAAWKKGDDLAARVPAPWVYGPQIWRRYQDTLLRYEQLLRAGDQSNADALKSDLGKLEIDLVSAPRVEGSLPYALPMPESLGVEAPWPREDLEHKVEDLLWNIPAEKWEENWAALKKWAQVDPAANDDLLRVQVDSILLDKAAADPDKGLETACKLVKFLDRGIKPRPAEAHFMVMLQRDMNRQPPPPANLRKLVLETRRLAEQVALSARGDARTPGASYSEKILPWTQAAVQAADAKRRPGEDQVFLSNDQGWTEAATLLNDAHDRYQKLQPTVAALREALNTYHEVLAALPYDSLWLARREGTDDRKLQANEKLWGDVHALADLLEDRQKTPDPNQIAVLTRDLQGEFKELTTEFQQEGQSLRDASATPGNLRRLQDVLVSPLIPADLRVRLVEKSREISRKLAEENKATGDTAAEPDAQALSDQQARALQAGVRQGRLALAVLGSTWVGPDYAPLSKKVREQSFAEVEEPLRQQWWRLLDEVQKRTASAANAPPNLAAGDLASAEHLARSMDGATVRFLDRDPVADNRRLLLHNLLVNQAERTVHDHWFAEQGKPYYQVAAGMDLRDAADLIGANRTDLDEDQKKVRLEAVARVEKMLGKDQPGVLQVDGLKEQSVTSQLSFDVKYTLSAQPGVQPGYPVAWCDLETPLAFLRPEDARRQRLEIAADRQGLKVLPQPVIAFTMKTPPEAAQAGATLHVRYRGQVIDFPTDVYMFSEPDVIAYEDTPRDKAAIAVRANEDFEGQGALAIVLDCSGSMNVPSKAGGETKFNEALDALQEVLQTIPRGTKVGVWIFGQKENEGVIQQLQAPDTWDPENNFGQLKRLMQKLRAITPYYETPLVKGIVTAKDALLDMRGLKGIKSMLVLTDGMDTEFKPQNRIGAYLKEQFVDTDIFVNMVFYKFDPPEDQAKAIAQFEAIRDLDVPGQLFQETDASKLAATMLQALRPKLRLEVNGALPRGVPKQGIDISLQRDDHLFWSPPLFPDDYTPRLASFRNLPDLLLQAGDRLVLSVTPKGLQRVLYGKSFFADSRISSEGLQAGGGSDPGSSSQPWLLSTLQNQLGPNNRSLQMMMTLENQAQLSPAAGESLQQIRPRFVWFEVSAPDTGPKGKGAQPRGIRWGNLADYPAPAWGLDVRQWPSGAQPLLQAWWRSDQAPYPLAEFKREDPARPIDQVFKDMDLPPGVHSLDVTVEQQQVAGEDNPRPCLVVRIKYDPDTPILALTSGLPLQRREHRFYYQAGQYTGLFWPTTAEQLTRARFTLSLISLKDFKDKAQAQNAYIKMPLPPPDHRARPEPVLLPGQ